MTLPTDDAPRRFSKSVAIKATDDDERTSTGIVLKANELDRQLDWLDGDGVRTMFNPSPGDGVMHAVFPNEHSELVRNEVLDEAETINGVEFEAGDWIIQRRYNDDTRWKLVKSGILSAYSIGGSVTDTDAYDSVDDLPDAVSVPDTVDPDSVAEKHLPITKIINGAVDEISDVDIGAVPSAEHAVVKGLGALTKNVLDETAGREEFVTLMQIRGAPEDGANALYDYMTGVEDDAEKQAQIDEMTDTNTHDGTDTANARIEDVDDATLGKRLKRLLWGKSEKDTTDPDDGPVIPEVPGGATDKALHIAKEGRSLNETNRAHLMAAHDTIESALASDMDISTNRFTDDPGMEFSVGEYGGGGGGAGDGGSGENEKRAFAAVLKDLTDEQTELVAEAIADFTDSQGDADVGTLRDWMWNQGDDLDADVRTALETALEDFYEDQRPDNQQVSGRFAEWVNGQTDTELELELMTDDDITDDGTEMDSEKNGDDPPAWAEDMIGKVDGLGERVADLEKEAGMETTIEDAPEWAQTLNEKVDNLGERVDSVSKATADTTQAGGAERGNEAPDETAEERAKTADLEAEVFG